MIQYILIFLFVFTSCENIYLGRNLKFQLGQLKLPEIFSDGMVLQRDTTVAIWGQSKPNKLVTITSSWGYNVSTTSDENGKWQTVVKTKKDPGPYSLKVKSGIKSIDIKDILMGEVWLASGQSNMEMTFDYCCNTTDSSKEEILTANYPHIRMFNVKKNLSIKPLETVKGSWESAIGERITDFSAAGYFFAKKLHKKLKVPIGIIHSSWGGSRIEAWTSHDVLSNIKQYNKKLSDLENLNDKAEYTRQHFERFESYPLASGPMDLLLAEMFPQIGYLDFYLPGWKKLDHIGQRHISETKDDRLWGVGMLDPENSLDKELGNTTVVGATIFKNSFKASDIKTNNYSIEIIPDKDAPWGLWEYDIYVNGSSRVGSSLIDLKGDSYRFNKVKKKYDIDTSFLIEGINIITVRVFGHAHLGKIVITDSNNSEVQLSRKWRFKVAAEEYSQFDNYQYPYTSLYVYDNVHVSLSTRPKAVDINNKTLGSLYNGMIHPIIPYGIKGIIWYQGETNTEQGGPEFEDYRMLFPLMVDDWRNKFGHEVPFYFAQIAPYFNYGGMLPHLRAAQNSFLSIPKTGMIVTLDIGEKYDIHPSNKHDVGYRFARLALNRAYGIKITDSGPIFNYFKKEGKILKVYFHYTGSGLVMSDYNNRSWFEIAGADKKYHEASVANYNNHLEISSINVRNPKYLRYAWSDTATATLFNLDGLPASPFSSEENMTGSAPFMSSFENDLNLTSPTDLQCIAQGNSILLSWTGSSSFSYKIERSLSEDFSEPIDEFYSNSNHYTDTDLQSFPHLTYFYRVTALYSDMHSDPTDVISIIYPK